MPTISIEKPCPRGHTNVKRSAKGTRRCPDCAREWRAQWYAENAARYLPATLEHRRIKGREWRARNLEKARASSRRYMHERRLRENFSLTVAEYEALVERQGGRCGICGETPEGRVLVVDHDHETGVIRGLLCTACNVGLGNLGDSADRLRAAIRWLNGGGQGADD